MTGTTIRSHTFLVMHRGLLHRRDDTLEVEAHLVGLLDAADDSERTVQVLASDGHDVFTPIRDGDDVVYAYESDFLSTAMRGRIDLVYVHMPVPIVHLLAALVLRVRGATVVLAPMAMLDREYAESGWFRPRRGFSCLAKRWCVRVLRGVWLGVAHWFVCLSAAEVQAAGLPRDRALLVPWAAPSSALTRAASRASQPHAAVPDAPVAFVSRMDPHRKGLDRLCRWLEAYRESLPRPAVVLFAPEGRDPVPGLTALERDGLVRWERDARGAELLEPLLRCRGSMLLSRWEAQPRCLREALLLGLPVLTTEPNMLDEAMALAGAGETVRGDDPASVHAAFLRLRGRARGSVSRQVFARDAIGRFLLHRFLELHEREPVGQRDYYATVTVDRCTRPRSARTMAATT